jgi:hypothetical protein
MIVWCWVLASRHDSVGGNTSEKTKKKSKSQAFDVKGILKADISTPWQKLISIIPLHNTLRLTAQRKTSPSTQISVKLNV